MNKYEDFFIKVNDVIEVLRTCDETLFNYTMSELTGLGYCCDEDYFEYKYKQNQEVEE